MHQHECRYCEKSFVCGEDRAKCFKRFIVCDGCFWNVEARYFALCFVLGIAAIVLTLVLAKHFK